MQTPKTSLRPQQFDMMKLTLYASVQDRALGQVRVPLGTVGNVAAEVRAAKTYCYWRYVDANGLPQREYIGSLESVADQAKVQSSQVEVAEWQALSRSSKELRALGFSFANQSAGTTFAALHNAGVFAGGGLIVGSHAYGALLNTLGFREVANYLTEDIDVARPQKIALVEPSRDSWATILNSTGFNFLPMPELDRKSGPTTYKLAGKSLMVDLLVPAKTRQAGVTRVPELDAYATALPYLDFLTGGGFLNAIVLTKDKIVPIRIPTAERFCVHKLLVSTLRSATLTAKAIKDRKQAGAIACALVDLGRAEELQTAVNELPRSARKQTKRAALLLVDQYLVREHPECANVLIDAFA